MKLIGKEIFSKLLGANYKKLSILLASLLLIVSIVKFISWFYPASVDGHKINRFQIWQTMEDKYGKQTLDDLINRKIIEIAIAKSGVEIDKNLVSEKVDELVSRVPSLDRDDAYRQVYTDLAIQEILKDKIAVTEDETIIYYGAHTEDLFEGKEFGEVRKEIESTLSEQKMMEESKKWMASIKGEIKVVNKGL